MKNKIDTNIEKNNNKDGFRNKLKKVFEILSFIWFVICSMSMFFLSGLFYITWLGVILIPVTILSFVSFLVFGIAILWILYGIIILIYNYSCRFGENQKKIFWKISFGIIILLTVLISLVFIYKKHNIDLYRTLESPPSYTYYDTTSYYFINNEKLYYYKFNKSEDELYSVNFDGTKNNKIASTDDLRFAKFYFVYNNDAYYYTSFYNQNKKVNLSSGTITTLNNNDIYLDKTLRNGVINAYSLNNDGGFYFKKIDLKNNKTIKENMVKYDVTPYKYLFDYDNVNVYYLEDNYSKVPTIYKNSEILYQFTDEVNDTFQFVTATENYVYFKIYNITYKLDVNIKEIVGTSVSDFEGERIDSDIDDNYFYMGGRIYEFNLGIENFNLLSIKVDSKPDYAYHIGDKIIFVNDVEQLEEKYNNIGIVYILDKKSKVTKYNNVRKISFDDKHLYLLIKYDTGYSVEKVEL